MKKECKECKRPKSIEFISISVFFIVLLGFFMINNSSSNITGDTIGVVCTHNDNCSAGTEFCFEGVCTGTCAYYTSEVNCTSDALSLAESSNNRYLLNISNYTQLPSGGFCDTDIALEYQGGVYTVKSCNCSWALSSCGDNPTLESVDSSCMPNWTATNTSCASNEELEMYYTDTNACGVTTGKPSNKTYDCDYDGNGLIGNNTHVTLTRYDLDFEIEGNVFNFSNTYSGTKNIIFKENDSVIVDFNWNFNKAFNFKKLKLKRQTDSATLGSIVINGLDVNKTVYIDRIANANKVCIKDAEVDSINEISNDCSDSDEYPLNCPGSGGGYSCSIVNNTFKITGLMHSGIIEFEDGNASASTCDANWSCSSWGPCSAGSQLRTCIDLNECNVSIGKPSETQSCEVECISTWSCTEWEDCKEGKEIRACVDLNECSTETDKPVEERECESVEVNWPLILGIFGGLIVLGIIVAIILYFLNKQADEEDEEGMGITPTTPPVTPGSVKPPRPMNIRQPRPPITRPMPRNSIRAKSAPMPKKLVNSTNPPAKPATKPIVKPAVKPAAKSPTPSGLPKVNPPPK